MLKLNVLAPCGLPVVTTRELFMAMGHKALDVLSTAHKLDGETVVKLDDNRLAVLVAAK
jgi:hypothetical protein